jgi:hypothetical protein
MLYIKLMTEATSQVVQRQTATAFDRAFQNLFTLVSEVLAVYRQCQAIDGSSHVDARLEEVPPHTLEERLKAYKTCFDSTGPEVHVDTVLELYSKVRSSLQRGYQCDSWLRNPETQLYYGLSVEAAGDRVINLDCVFLMLEALKRADTRFRSQAAVLRIKFSNQLYSIFMAALRYANVVEKEVNVRGVTPVATIESDVAVLEGLQTDILNDIPKPAAPPADGPSNPMAALSSMFPGGMSNMLSSLSQLLPSLTQTMTEKVSEATGNPITAGDQEAINTTMTNITELLRSPDGLSSMFAELSNGPDGIGRFVKRLLDPSAGPAPGAAPALD